MLAKQTVRETSTKVFPLLRPLNNLEIDYSFLHTHFGDKEEPLQEMLNLFLLVVEPEIVNLKQHQEESNWNAYSDSVHRIKSNLRFLGFHELLKTAEWLENAVKEKSSSYQLSAILKDFAKGLELAAGLVINELTQRPNAANQ